MRPFQVTIEFHNPNFYYIAIASRESDGKTKILNAMAFDYIRPEGYVYTEPTESLIQEAHQAVFNIAFRNNGLAVLLCNWELEYSKKELFELLKHLHHTPNGANILHFLIGLSVIVAPEYRENEVILFQETHLLEYRNSQVKDKIAEDNESEVEYS